MKISKILRSRIISMILAAAMCLSLVGNVSFVTAANSTDSGDTYVYIPVKDLSNASRYEGGSIVQNFNDTHLDGIYATNPTLLLQNSGDQVEYDIDLDDAETEAVLKVYAKHAQVSVKASGGEFVTLTAKNGAAADRGVNLFDLSEANALASADNKFTVRISVHDQAVVLNALLVMTRQPELKDTYTLDPLGESYLQNVVDVSAGATRYFLNQTQPTIYLHNGEAVTFAFDYADDASGIRFDFTQAGAALTAEISADGTSWSAITSGAQVESVISLPAGNTFQVRFTAAAGDAFLSGLTLTPAYTITGIDAGKELYLPLNSLSVASKYSGTGLVENFNDTHQGGNNVTNPTLLLQNPGDYVEYSFDMADDVTSAWLKILTTGGKVEVKAEGGEFVTLSAVNGSGFNRGLAIYELTEANALAAGGRRFTLRISQDGGTVVLNALLLQAQTTELTGTYTLDPLGESYLKQVTGVSAGASRYFFNETQPTIYLHGNESVTMAFDYADDASGIRFDFTQAGAALTAEISADGTSWSAITSGAQVESVISLPAGNTFQVRFTAAAGDAFLSGLTLTPAYTITGIDAGKELYLPLNSLSVASKYSGTGLVENFNDTHLDGKNVTNPTLLLQNPGDYVEYNFDMADDVTSAWLKILTTGGKVEVKAEGGEFVTLNAVNGSGFNRGLAIYELTEANALAAGGRRFTLRISQDGGTVVLNALLLQAQTAEVEKYTLDPLGESYLQNVVDVSAGATRYFLNQTQPTIYLHGGESASFQFDFIDDAAGVLFTFSQAGGALTAEVSADGTSWSAISSGTPVESVISLPAGNAFHVRLTAENGDAFLSGMELTATYGVVEEKDYIFLPIQDLSNADRFGGGSIAENFEDTYLGGIADKLENLTLLLQNAGDYVEYDINLPDNVDAATLKIYMMGGVVSVKPKGGEYVTLTAVNGSAFDRNAAIYNLTTADALASGERQFTVRIASGGGAVVINALMVQTELAELSGGYELDILGENFLHNLHSISGTASRYFANEKDATVFLHNGDQVTFAFDFADNTESLIYSYSNLGQPLTVHISADGENWVALPAGGRIEDTLELNEGVTFFIRFQAEQGDSFLQSLSLTPAEPEAVAEQDYVYLPLKDLSNTTGYGGNGIHENFTDTYSNGDPEKMTNLTMLLQNPGDYVEYRFNLSDSVTNARLLVYMTDAVVSVKARGGEFITLTALNEEGGRFNRGVAVYDLTEANALADGSRQFTLRISCNGKDTAVLNALVVTALTQQMDTSYILEPLGESFLQGLWDLSQATSRYFHETSIPTVHIPNGGYVTFRMNFAPGGACYPVQYTTLGAQPVVEVSLDGTNWVVLKGERVDKALDMSGTGTYYLRFSASNGESFLLSLAATRETTAPVEPVNTNPNVPKDSEHIFFQTGSAEEEKYMYGLGDDFKAYFEGTHDGMGIDGFEGGYSETLPANARLFHGKHITYEFDLADSADSAVLKLYGLGNMEFLFSADNGETWEALTPTNAPVDNGRGYYIIHLDDANALRGDDNRFLLQIKGTFGILMGLMIQTEEPVVTNSVHFDIRCESSLSYLVATNGLRTYYADTAFANYFLDENGYVEYKLPFGEDIKSAVLYATYSGDVHIEIAGADRNYQTLLRSVLGASGTPHTNTFDLSAYLASGSTLYIRVTGSAAGGFLDSMGISVPQSNETQGGFDVFTDSEAKYLLSISENGQGIGTAKRVTVDLHKARGIDVGGAVIYRLNLADNINGADLFVNAEGKYEVTVSLDGVNFVSIAEAGKETDGLRVIDPLPDSEDKVLYVKISNMSDTDVLVLHGMTFSTEDVPAYERPDVPDFGYDDEIPDEIPEGSTATEPTEPDAIPGGSVEEPKTDSSRLWIFVGAAAAAAVVLIAIVILLIKKKKNGQ